jgi:Domain of unknown function (DUF1707)
MAEETNHYSRRTPADRDLRASDADRTAVGDILRKEHVAGRLDTDEFADRFGRCLEAKTYAQLDVLVADLPEGADAPSLAGSVPRSGTAWQGGPWYGPRRPRRVPAMAWLVLVGLLVALSGGPALWVLVPLVMLFVVRPFMWRSSWRSGWGRRGGGCGPGAYGTWL